MMMASPQKQGQVAAGHGQPGQLDQQLDHSSASASVSPFVVSAEPPVSIAASSGSAGQDVAVAAPAPTELAKLPKLAGRVITGTGGQVKRIQCFFLCGPPYPEEFFGRSNQKALWRCKCCFQAEKAINSSVSGCPQARDALNQLKEKDPELWKSKVRACRVIDPRNTTPGQTGVNSLVERKVSVASFQTWLMQTLSVEHFGDNVWLLEGEFIDWMERNRKLSRQEASQLWTARETTPTSGSGGQRAAPAWRSPSLPALVLE